MRTHSFLLLVKTLVDGHTCKICLRCFPSISRHIHHLEHVSKSCLTAWESLDIPITVSMQHEVEHIRICEARHLVSLGYRETKSMSPVIVCPGPLRQLPTQPSEVLQLEVPTILLDYDPDIPPPPAPYCHMTTLTSGADGKAIPTEKLDPDSLTSASFFRLGPSSNSRLSWSFTFSLGKEGNMTFSQSLSGFFRPQLTRQTSVFSLSISCCTLNWVISQIPKPLHFGRTS